MEIILREEISRGKEGGVGGIVCGVARTLGIYWRAKLRPLSEPISYEWITLWMKGKSKRHNNISQDLRNAIKNNIIIIKYVILSNDEAIFSSTRTL